MAATGDSEDDWVVLECMDPTLLETSPEITLLSETSISTADISSWDMPAILSHQIVKVNINRSRLIEESSYFRTLLAGNFSESLTGSISVYWSLETFLHLVRFMNGFDMEVTLRGFLPLLQAALYFGFERLVLECKTWFADVIVKEGLSLQQLRLDDLIRFRDFALEHAVDWLVEQCTSCVARNFIWAMSCDTFVDLSYDFIFSCVKHPDLTVYSERHLCEALLAWVSANIEPVETSCTRDVWIDMCNHLNINTYHRTNMLEEIRVDLLPLWYIMGKCRCQYFSSFAKHGVSNSTGLLKRMSKSSNYMDVADDLSNARVRLTEYLKKLDLSGCLQITEIVLLLSLLRQSDVPALLNVIRTTNLDLDYQNWFSLFPLVSFEAMTDVDISKCSQLHLNTVMDCFKKSFPLLRTIRMAYFLNFETKNFCNLMENSVVCEVYLTVDVSPLVSSNVSVSYTEAVSRRPQKGYFDMSCRGPRPRLSHMSKLTLEGRSDFSDTELLDIAECCDSLFYLNIRGCLSVTDTGIANLIIKCRKLHSIIATDTSFGRSSISALCSRALGSAYSPLKEVDNNLELSGINIQMLHIGGCKGVCDTSLVGLLSRGHLLKNLCLRDTDLSDQALYSFRGSFLEVFDVSNTMISNDALLHIIVNNPGLKYFEACGCRKLCLNGNKNIEDSSPTLYPCERLFSMLGNECRLEKLAIGWGFSDLMIRVIGPGLTSLKALTVGLGGTLGPEGLKLLCTLCPLLESVSISFQVISDIVIMQLLGMLRNLRALSVSYCIGDISPLALTCCAPHLRKLKLERVTPWMANDNLSLLAQNCANLIELSLVGCSGLDLGAQQIISSGWPGLISLHLEDCGAVTANGVAALFDCKAMEDLLLRHNGCGIQKNFIVYAASKLPMLRSLSLDWCDASEGELDLPNALKRYTCDLSLAVIATCSFNEFETKKETCIVAFPYHQAAQAAFCG